MLIAIVIPVDTGEPIRLEEVERPDLSDGVLRRLDLHRPTASLFVHAAGMEAGLPINPRATALLWAHNSASRGQDAVVGQAVILGPGVEPATVPDDLEQLLFYTERFRVEVTVSGETGWHGNEKVFDKWATAYSHGVDLVQRWTLAEEVRIIPDRRREVERLITEWMKLGEKNPWIKYATDPPFTRDSFYVCYTVDELEERIGYTNWCVGQAFVYRDLCLINQDDGGDEWLTIRHGVAFESFTFGSYIKRHEFAAIIRRLLAASKEQCETLKY